MIYTRLNLALYVRAVHIGDIHFQSLVGLLRKKFRVHSHVLNLPVNGIQMFIVRRRYLNEHRSCPVRIELCEDIVIKQLIIALLLSTLGHNRPIQTPAECLRYRRLADGVIPQYHRNIVLLVAAKINLIHTLVTHKILHFKCLKLHSYLLLPAICLVSDFR